MPFYLKDGLLFSACSLAPFDPAVRATVVVWGISGKNIKDKMIHLWFIKPGSLK